MMVKAVVLLASGPARVQLLAAKAEADVCIAAAFCKEVATALAVVPDGFVEE